MIILELNDEVIFWKWEVIVKVIVKVIDYFTSNRLQVQLLLKVIVITITMITITFGPITVVQ